MKTLNGSEIAAFIKERQAKKVRSLRQGDGVEPKLAIVKTIDDKVIDTYVRLKKSYGSDIGVLVDVHSVDQADVVGLINELNQDDSVHGIIVQLPLQNNDESKLVLNAVSADKDVDGLSADSMFEPATPLAIEWLLDGYNVELDGKKIVIVGRGRLVGAPLEKMLLARGLDVQSVDKSTEDITSVLKTADVVIAATGQPDLITSDMLGEKTVALDAGVATADKKTVGDFHESVYARSDLSLTPKKGGVGPLTVSALLRTS